MARIPNIDPSELTGKAAEVHRAMSTGLRGPGRVRGPLLAWLRSPRFAERAQGIGEYLRFQSPLSGRLAELAILVVARHWSANFEWFAHVDLALKAGITSSVVDAIGHDAEPRFDKDDERVVYRMVRQLLETGRVTDDLYAQGLSLFNEEGLVDLAGIVGYYTLGAFTLSMFEIEPEPGAQPVLPVRSGAGLLAVSAESDSR